MVANGIAEEVTNELLKEFVGGQMDLLVQDSEMPKTRYRAEIADMSLDEENGHIVVMLKWMAKKADSGWVLVKLNSAEHLIPLRYTIFEETGPMVIRLFLQYIFNRYQFFKKEDNRIVPTSRINGLVLDPPAALESQRLEEK